MTLRRKFCRATLCGDNFADTWWGWLWAWHCDWWLGEDVYCPQHRPDDCLRIPLHLVHPLETSPE